MRSLKNTNKGITLIALIITIIVMLILVAVTISMAINGGLFEYAGKAVSDTQNAIDAEQTLADGGINIDGEWYESIDVYLEKFKKDENPGVLEKIGTETYEINSIEDLVALSYSVNNEETTYLGKTIELGKNLDFKSDSSYANPQAKYIFDSADKGYKPDQEGSSIKELLLGDNGFIPIGTKETNGFYGTVEGNNRVIKNMKITTNEFGGLIGTVKENTQIYIKNLGVEEININGNAIAGGIIGVEYGCESIEIINCHTTGKINASVNAGGIIGHLYATEGTIRITKCYNKGTVTGGSVVGGILGGCNSTKATIIVDNCYNMGTVNGGVPTGGILASGSGTISNCYNEGDVVSTHLSGGIAASFNGEVKNCYNKGAIKGDQPTGGILGTWSGTITNCYNEGNVTSDDVSGGIVAQGQGKIENCYNIGTIKGGSYPTGGILAAELGTTTMVNCYNVGNVSSSGSLVGSIIGASTETALSNCFYRKGLTIPAVGVGNYTGSLVEKDADYMKTEDFLEELIGDETDSVWTRDNQINEGMPILNFHKDLNK